MTPHGLIVGSPTITAPSLVSMPRGAPRQAWHRYRQHRWNAAKRPVPFEISFPDWLAIWWYSGHWFERGNRRGQWVMARPGDVGSYHKDNVFITPHVENTVAAHIGKKRSDATRRKMRKAARRNAQEGTTWLARVRAIRRSPAMRRLVSRNSKAAWARRSAQRDEARP
jgi:hypothetical protein